MATFTSDRAAKFLSVLYLLIFFAGTVIIYTIKVEYSPQSKVNFFTIGLAANSCAQGCTCALALTSFSFLSS